MTNPRLDEEGFIVNAEADDKLKSGIATTDEGGVIDIIYRKAKTRKWYILFFPFLDFSDVIIKIEHTYYPPKSDKNRGFEMSIMLDKQTVLVMCYKQYMTPAQLQEIFAGSSDHKVPLNPDQDIAFLRMRGEDARTTALRWAFFQEFMDYSTKQERGQ